SAQTGSSSVETTTPTAGLLSSWQSRLPTIFPDGSFAKQGGLIAYGVDDVDQWRHAAGYIDRILKGAKPSELPIELGTKFELAINLKTAKALGITVPQILLAAADELIE